MTAPRWLTELLAEHSRDGLIQYDCRCGADCRNWTGVGQHANHVADVVWQEVSRRGDDRLDELHVEAEGWAHEAVGLHREITDLRSGLRALADSNHHADTCGSVLSPGAGYPCSCWKADAYALLGVDA